jgi:hypothetical protein
MSDMLHFVRKFPESVADMSDEKQTKEPQICDWCRETFAPQYIDQRMCQSCLDSE